MITRMMVIAGMALFFSTSQYDALCEKLGLLRFALSPAEEARLEAHAATASSTRASATPDDGSSSWSSLPTARRAARVSAETLAELPPLPHGACLPDGRARAQLGAERSRADDKQGSNCARLAAAEASLHKRRNSLIGRRCSQTSKWKAASLLVPTAAARLSPGPASPRPLPPSLARWRLPLPLRSRGAMSTLPRSTSLR